MRTRVFNLARLMVAASVIVALGFGTREALAGTRSSEPCQPCPYPDQDECIMCCILELGGSGGVCTQGGSCICT